MKKIIVNEGQYRLINEYHHSYDNGLQNAAIEIANAICELAKKGWANNLIGLYDNDYKLSESPFLYTLNCFNKPIILRVYAWSIGEAAAHASQNKIYVGNKLILDALENNNIEYLTQTIYHELGHLTNEVYGGQSEGKRDFLTPIFPKMPNNIYEKISKALYRFLSRELKARCFETTMFLKNNANRNITIQDVYDNRCSDISMMRRFIKTLKYLSSLGENNETAAYIINQLYKDCIDKFKNPSWDNKCRKLIMFFEIKLQWIKKRIDKIYYDYTEGFIR